jgi:hypothetical protein
MINDSTNRLCGVMEQVSHAWNISWTAVFLRGSGRINVAKGFERIQDSKDVFCTLLSPPKNPFPFHYYLPIEKGASYLNTTSLDQKRVVLKNK